LKQNRPKSKKTRRSGGPFYSGLLFQSKSGIPRSQMQQSMFVQQTVIPSFCCSGALPQNGHGLRLISGCLITARPFDLNLEFPRLGTAAVKLILICWRRAS